MLITIEVITKDTMTTASGLLQELWEDMDAVEAEEDCYRALQGQDTAIFLAKANDKHVGFIFLSLRKDYVEGARNSPVAYIEGIYVKEEYQRQGIGERLVQQGEAWGSAKGVTAYGSDAELDNLKSIAFHKKAGFSIANQVVCFIKPISLK